MYNTQKEGELCWLEWGRPGKLDGLVPTLSCFGPLGPVALHWRTIAPADLWGPFWPESCCYSRKMLKMSLLLSPDPPSVTSFIEMEQSGRIKSHAGDLSFKVTISSPMITTEKKKWAWKTALLCLWPTSSPPQDNDRHCLLENSRGENPV